MLVLNCFVVPYFGKLSLFTRLSLKSISSIVDKVFLFTDDKSYISEDEKIDVIYIKLSDISNMIKNELNINVELTTPYKLCDFKPFYGKIFSKYVDEYNLVCFGDTDCFYSAELSKRLKKFENNFSDVSAIGGNRGHFMVMTKKFIEEFQQRAYDYFGSNKLSKILTCPKNFAFDEFDFLHLMLRDISKKEMCYWDEFLLEDHLDVPTLQRIPKFKDHDIKKILISENMVYVDLENEVRLSPPYLHIQKRKLISSINYDSEVDSYINFSCDGSIYISNDIVYFNKRSVIRDIVWFCNMKLQRVKAKIYREKLIR